MGQTKKVPMRTCIGCRQAKNKKELIRVVKNKEGQVFVDLTGRQNGRGAYICANKDCLEKAITRALATIERTMEKASYWDKFRNVDINERQRKVLNRLWDGFEGKLTSSKWAKICRCSQDTALRDINNLISKGMLRDSGEGGRSTNYLLP